MIASHQPDGAGLAALLRAVPPRLVHLALADNTHGGCRSREATMRECRDRERHRACAAQTVGIRHAPAHRYYRSSNSVDAFFRCTAPLLWRIDCFKPLVSMDFGHVVQVAPRRLRLSMINGSPRQALIGRLGKLRP